MQVSARWLSLVCLCGSLAACSGDVGFTNVDGGLPPDGGEEQDGGGTGGDGGTGGGGGGGNGDGDAGKQDAGDNRVPPVGCGDGVIDPEADDAPACDDGNSDNGDGCDRVCELEAGWLCPPTGGACVPKCGDGLILGDEACDDGDGEDGDGCDASCLVEAGWLCPPEGGACSAEGCGDGVVAGDESCEDGNAFGGDGCGADCQVEAGWICVGASCSAEACGDGIRAGGELCDDGNEDSGDGCLADCSGTEPFFTCPTPGELCTKTTKCGDGLVTPDEGCDDHNRRAGDGCASDCTVEDGWTCPGGRMCQSVCGDGIVAGTEQCDDAGNGAGCDDQCNLEEGYHCPDPGAACLEAECGNNEREGLEQCDDGNNDMGDGCSPLCTSEPVCKDGTCTTQCGDGIFLDDDGDEECDDGNTRNNDGCSSDCKLEDGYLCEHVQATPAATVEIPVVYRDFRTDHPDFERSGSGGKGMVKDLLMADGKPELLATKGVVDSAATFDEWYRDGSRNMTIVSTLTLNQLSGDTYEFYDPCFFPLTGTGYNAPGVDNFQDGHQVNCGGLNAKRNYHFTSEVRYWFRYEGDEVLNFHGDDDVWVFINGQLAVDIGGIHGPQAGCISLESDQSGCSVSNKNLKSPAELGLEVGKIYEVVVFQAERHYTGSNYKLTLAGFFTSKTVCVSDCGDGIVTPDELCDVGNENMSMPGYEGCNETCDGRGAYCGDGTSDNGFEACDDGAADNDGSYEGCNPDCSAGPSCGDGSVDGFWGEQCDQGAANVDGTYGACQTNCTLGPRCGDKTVQRDQGEACDDGLNRSQYGGCAPGCVLAPFCGDGMLQRVRGEQCDNGTDGNVGGYGGCHADCTRASFCGDGVVDEGDGEQCDDGNTNSFDGCSKACLKEGILI